MMVKEQRGSYRKKLLDLRNDFVFKSFFGDKRNTRFLLSFINSILDEEIRSIELVDPHIESTHQNNKKSIMDVRVETMNGEQINIEMQIEGHQAFRERMYLYMAKMYVSQDKAAKSYTDYKRAVQIIVTDFELLKEKDYHNVYKIMNVKSGSIFTKHYETHVLELPKFQVENKVAASELEKWLLFLKGDERTKEALAVESSMMRDAYEEIERLSQDPKTKRLAEYRERELKDMRQRELDAREEGIEQGIEQNQRDTVLKMYEKGLTVQDIFELTEVPVEKINRIIPSIKE